MPVKKPSARAPAVQAGRVPEWAVRLSLIVFSPIVFILLTELILRLFAYGEPSSFFVWRSASRDYVTNEKFALQFGGPRTPLRPFLFTVPARKDTNTIRICVLGESAAMGTPDPAYGISRMLEAQLKSLYPVANFEVLNAAMRGVNSYAVRKIARDCAAHEIDVFVVYLGNNEIIGLHGPTPEMPSWAQSLTLIRFLDWVKAQRTGQLLASWLEKEESTTQEMEYFRAHRMRADDPKMIKARENFRANLKDILATVTAHGAKVLVSTVAVNLKDCPPLASLHRADWTPADEARWDELWNKAARLEASGDLSGATNCYSEALALDASHAELHYRLARCFGALSRHAEARTEYQLACDWDALKFRTETRLNQIIREEAAAGEGKGVFLVDAAQAFAESSLSENGVPGQRLFYEHVHPTFSGNFLLSTVCLRALEPLLQEKAAPPSGKLWTEAECAERIGYTLYDHVNVAAAMTRLCGGPPFLDQFEHAKTQAIRERESKRMLAEFNLEQAERCIASYRAVLAREPDFWPMRQNLGALLLELKRYSEAAREFQALAEAHPHYLQFHIQFGTALLRMGQQQEALAEFNRALRLRPNDPNVRQLVARLSKR